MEENTRETIELILKKRQAYNCIECGKCSAVCPIARLNPEYYPRIILRKAMYLSPEMMADGLLWSCLNCGLCDERCELDVKFYEFVKDLRAQSEKLGVEKCQTPHNGGLHAWMAVMANPEMKQDRLGWLEDGMNWDKEGEVLYFVGCLPYYDEFFTRFKPDTLSIAKSTVRILNALGIKPAIMANERCCGHDFLWGGNVEGFKDLARINMEEIKATGAKKIVTACAECFNTLKFRYPEYLGKLGVDVVHISELVAASLPELKLKTPDRRVSFQDPCRLGRLGGVFEEPRKVLAAVEGIELREMDRNRKSAICCGTSGWLTCGTYSKQIQTERLKEAKRTGADLLVTSCPKCQIHFKCSMWDEKTGEDAKIEVQDLTTLIADCLT